MFYWYDILYSQFSSWWLQQALITLCSFYRQYCKITHFHCTCDNKATNLFLSFSVTTPIPPPLTTMNLILVFDVQFDCQNSDILDNYKGLIRNKVIAQLTVLAVVYPLLCSSTTSCTNINNLVVIIDACVLASAGRRRAVADNRITFSVQVPDIP